MSTRKQYMLMEVVGDGPKFRGNADSWLCLWTYRISFLDELLEDVAPGTPVNIRFTFMEMTDGEHAEYCEQHEIEWE